MVAKLAGHVALIGISGPMCDGSQWLRGLPEQPGRVQQALPPKKVADGATHGIPERAGQMLGTDAKLAGEITHSRRLAPSFLKQLDDLPDEV